MRRREPPASAVDEMPERLRRYVAAEWLPFVGPEPEWWWEDCGPYWRFQAHILWNQARNNWRTAAGEGWWGKKPEGRATTAADLAEVGIEPPDGAAA